MPLRMIIVIFSLMRYTILFPLRAGFTKFTGFHDYVVCGKQIRYVSHYKSNPENPENR
jgi:hypothetical protein